LLTITILLPASKCFHRRISAAGRREASNVPIAVVMAGISRVFIAGPASAFIYAKDPKRGQVASERAAVKPPAEIIGSGAQ
jgi:hypothetical protein